MRKRVQLLRFSAAVMAVALTGVVAQQAGSAQAAVTPSVVAASQVQNLINTVRGEPGTYAGLWIDGAQHTVYVSAAKAAVTAGTVEALTARAASGGATMKLVVVHAKYDFAQLATIDARVMHDPGLLNAAKAAHATLSQWYPDPVTDKVVIAFTRVTAAERAAVSAEYGTTARVVTAPISYSAVGTAADSPKSSRRQVHPDSRTADSAPWFGGDEISGFAGDVCTSGFEWSGGFMTTAGHCGNTTFINNGATVGVTRNIQWGNGRIDMQLLGGSVYDPDIWAGPSGDTAEPVSGSGGVADGGTYCTSGYVTGQNCTAIVYAIDACVVENDNGTDVDVCDLDEAHSGGAFAIALPGDSGGPVFTSNSTLDPYAVGTISGYGDDGQIAQWSDMYMEEEIFGGAPVTA
jgi:hypothetical protein